jgi:hypothetical protein
MIIAPFVYVLILILFFLAIEQTKLTALWALALQLHSEDSEMMMARGLQQ